MDACLGLAQLGSGADSPVWTSIIVCHSFFARYSIGGILSRLSWGLPFVVITVPLLGYRFHFFYTSEDVCVKYSLSVTAVEPFHISVLGRTSRLGIQNTYIVPFAPILEILWNELRAVIVSDVFRLAVQPDYLFQCLHHPSCRKRYRNLLGHSHLIASSASVSSRFSW